MIGFRTFFINNYPSGTFIGKYFLFTLYKTLFQAAFSFNIFRLFDIFTLFVCLHILFAFQLTKHHIISLKMAHRPQDSFSRPNDTYHSIRDQLQRETTALIQERNSLNVQRPSNPYFPSYRNIEGSPRSKVTQENYQKIASNPIDLAKKAEIKNRIKEIIDLCRDQNAAVTRDIGGVMQSQKGIYNLLQQADFEQARLPHPEAPPQVAPTPIAYTPIRSHQEAVHPGKNLQRDIRSIIDQNRHIHLSEQALQLIEQIERRSLAEIQKLRDEKLAVVAQLNDEIRRNNDQKRRNAQLQRELEFYRKNQGTADPRYENELRAKVAYLQNLLNSQQGGKTGEFPDFNLLFAQGEAIRQETLRLLKLKEAKVQGDDTEKRRLREQVERLQKKVQYLEQQRNIAGRGKTSYQVINEEYSPIAPSHKRKDSYRNSANEYQSLVMEMRKITSN